MSEYYRAYEERYRIVHAVTDELWGHSPEDEAFVQTLTDWVNDNRLLGRRVIEFACGEGASAPVLADLGCVYQGVDIAPTAIGIAKKLAGDRANVSFDVLDMVHQSPGTGEYDAALDVSGLHMLVTDQDRAAYLMNVYEALKPGGCAMFWQESYRRDAYEGEVADIDAWKRETGLDFDTPEKRRIGEGQEVMLKLLPARPKNEAGYRAEMERAGFVVDEFLELGDSDFIALSACIKVHRPL